MRFRKRKTFLLAAAIAIANNLVWMFSRRKRHHLRASFRVRVMLAREFDLLWPWTKSKPIDWDRLYYGDPIEEAGIHSLSSDVELGPDEVNELRTAWVNRYRGPG